MAHEADSIRCELTCDATWRLPEITEEDFKGGWSPALAGRGMSQRSTGDYCKQNPIGAHRLVWSGEMSVTHSASTPNQSQGSEAISEDRYAYTSFMHFLPYL